MPAESRLLHELAVEEKAVIDAHEALRIAEEEFQVAARKYAAVRTLLSDALGYSPYHEDVVWVAEADQIVPPDQRGRYRFLEMKPREAILAALAEVDSELTLKQLTERLRSGGLDSGMRAINAALLRSGGVRRTAKGAYCLAKGGHQRDAA